MYNNILAFRIISIIIISAGYGWAGGHYIPSDSAPIAYIFQAILLAVFLILATTYLRLPEEKKWKRHWSIRGLTIFSIISLLINIANIIHGALNKSPASFGSHNTLADLVPIGIILAGTTLWLVTLFNKTNLLITD